jgi:serine/threonine protein kinase/Tfp pilus assembly protein PilF
MIGRTIAHYRIEAEIGRGGMGVVYRARDEKLERVVALKFLPTDAGPDVKAQTRLLGEARTAAALNHPHICMIHEVGEEEGRAFIAMELVEGRPLREMVPAEGLPVDAVARYGAQIADALGHAHSRGVVHRDLKTANVVVTPEGHAKVLDFGLAVRRQEDVDEATRSRLSLEGQGALAGTLQYLAPEVLRGQPADARSDLWALGVVLYEMAGGSLPFRGATGYEVSSAILHETPRPLSARVPAGLRGVIQRCLAKEPGQRYQRASEARAALEAIAREDSGSAAQSTRVAPRRKVLWIASGGIAVVLLLAALALPRIREWSGAGLATPRIESVAVLPLKNLSGDPNQEYFADGMTEALITELAQVRSLRVISRTSVMQYKGARKPLPEIARELGVDAVLEGSVARADDRVRITAQLIEASRDRHLWAESFDRDYRDVLLLQSDVARAVAQRIRAQMSPRGEAQPVSARPVNTAAYEAYLLGLHYLRKRTPDSLARALEHCEEAVRLDPTFALGWALQSEVHRVRDIFGGLPLGASAEAARLATRKALELDDSLAEAHNALAEIHFMYDWDWEAAEREYQKAIQLNPSLTSAHSGYAYFLTAMARHPEAVASIERAREVEPASAEMLDHAGRIYYRARQFEKAIQFYGRAIELDPQRPITWTRLADALEQVGRFDEALAALAKGSEVRGTSWAAPRLAQHYALRGDKRKARALLQEYEQQGLDRGFVGLAMAYAALGDIDKSFYWLEQGIEKRAILPFNMVDPPLEPLRADPRFSALKQKMRLPW